MTTHIQVPKDHPRAESLELREKIWLGIESNVVSPMGMIAHGRGEAFDYLIGEKTIEPAEGAIKAAAAALLLARHPIISVNGNTAVLVPKELAKLSEVTGAKLEVNLFHRSSERELAIQKILLKAGAEEVLGVNGNASAQIPELSSLRRKVDPQGILAADVVLVPLEDGDRTEALMRMGKTVIAIDINPLSRTAMKASITIVDNVVRALPLLVEACSQLGHLDLRSLGKLVQHYDNRRNLAECVLEIDRRLMKLYRSFLGG